MCGTTMLWDAETGKLVATFKGEQRRGLWAAKLSPDGKLLASGGGYDKTIKLWDVVKAGT